jgi:hypothetical protein
MRPTPPAGGAGAASPGGGSAAGLNASLASTLGASGLGLGLRQRGLYSDLNSTLADATAGPAASYGGWAAAGKAVPFAYQFKSAAGGHAALARKLHIASSVALATPGDSGLSATAGGNSIYADVPIRALEPKVFVPHARAPGAPPRRVEVERKKRQFMSAQLEELLRGPRPSWRT